MTAVATKLAIQGELLRQLAAWSDYRSARSDWMEDEEARMHALVNTYRSEAGLAPVARKTVARVNQAASGHIDYAHKFTLYCAELALGQEPWPGVVEELECGCCPCGGSVATCPTREMCPRPPPCPIHDAAGATR